VFSTLANKLAEHPLRRFFNQDDRARSDLINPACMVVLGLLGVFFIYAAQSYNPDANDWRKQVVWLVMGAGVYSVVSLTHYKFFLQYAHVVYAAAVLLLVPLAVEAALGLNLPLVETRFGATRWMDFGPFSFQPSEVAKFGVLVMGASLLARSEIGGVSRSLLVLVKVAVAFGVPILLIFLQPDLGSTLVFPVMAFSLLYVSKLSIKFFVAASALFLIALFVVGVDIYRYQAHYRENDLSFINDRGAYEAASLLPLRDYQRERILSFVAPAVVDPQGIGVSWNQRQSLYAVASGGLLGKGPGKGTQAALGYLPSTIATNDFIFSVLSEEIGFIGGAFVIGLLAVLVLNGVRIAGMARDRFGMLLALGVSVIFMVHIFINVGMTIGLMPITGLPLPFLSYGGSFVLSCCVLQGLVQSVYRFRRDFT